MPRKDARRKRQRAKVVASRSDSAHDARVLARHSASMARRSGAAAAPRGGGSGPCVVAVEATSRFAGRADVWWTPRCAASAALVVFATCVRVVEEEEEVVAAATTAAAGGDKYEDVGEAFEVARARGDAIGAVVVDERLPRDALFSFHIEVSSSLSSSSSTSSSSSSCSRTSSRSSAAAAASGRSRPIKISPARFSWAPMKKVNLWRGDCEALRRYIESPRIATWCANEHLGVLRALHSRGLGLLATPRLAVAAHDRSPSLFAAQRAACGCESAMRLVLRFATPLCLPTTDELQDMLAACMAGPEGAANFADFIDAGVDPNIIVDGSGGLPLIHLAAQRGDAKSVRRLLDAGARPPHRARGPGRTALCAAATGVSAGHTAVVEILLNARFSHINAMCRDEEGAEDGNVAVAVANDASNADGMHVEVPPPPLHLTALCAAARSGHLAAVKLLIAAGADTELVVTRSSTVTDREGGGADVDSSCVTPLCYAARSGHADVVSNLIEAGARYKHTDFAPLCDAAAGGHAEVVTLLCERGVDPNEVGIVRAAMPPADATALLAAARNGHAAVVELLLASGANVNRGALEGGYTPIWCAAESNRGACVAILLASGADVEREVNVSCGGTPLVVAARMGHAAIVTQLLDAGAHADYTLPRKSRGEEGWTLAHRVCPYTALHAAAEKGHHDAVLALLVAGADKKIRNGNGQTAVVVAECEGHTPLVHLLSATNPSHDRARKERKMGRKWVLERAEAKPLPLFVRGEELVGNIVWVPPEEKTNEGWEKVNVKGYLPDREFPYQIVFLWSGNPDHNTGDEDEWERADFDAARCMPTHPPLTTSSAFDEIEERLEELFEVADNNDDDDDVEVEESRGGRSGSEGSGSASNVASTAGQSPTTKAKVIHEVSNRLREVAPASSGPIVGERALDLLARKVSKAGGTVDDAVDICRCVCAPPLRVVVLLLFVPTLSPTAYGIDPFHAYAIFSR